MALSVAAIATPTIENGFVGSGDTVTISGFTVSGTDKVLFICIALWQDVGGTGTVSGVTWNGGQSFTKIAEKTVTGGAMRAEIWRLINPADATGNIVATINGATDARKMGAVLFNGAGQTDPDEATQTAEGTTGPITLNITTLTDGAIVIDAAANFSTDALTIGAGQTQIMDDQTGNTGGVASHEAKAVAGSVTMSWTKAGSNDWAQVAVSVKPAASTPIAPNDGAWTFTADAATFTQNHVISPTDASWAFTADAAVATAGPAKPLTGYAKITKPTTAYAAPTKPRTAHTRQTKPLTEYF